MPLPTQIAVAITTDAGGEFAITHGGELIASQEYSIGLKCRVQFGRATVQQIDRLVECLNRLKVHAVEA